MGAVSPSRSASRRFWVAMAVVGIPMMVVPVADRVAEARGSPLPPLLCFTRLGAHFDALRAFMADSTVGRFLNDRVATGAVWHMSTVSDNGSGWRVDVLSAGKKRNSTRLSRATFVRVPDPMSALGPRYELASQGFSQVDLGRAPCVSTREELEILQSAFNSTDVRETLLRLFKYDVQAVTVKQDIITGNRELLFISSESSGQVSQVLAFRVERGNLGWQFIYP